MKKNNYIEILSINDLHGAFDGNGHETMAHETKVPGMIRLGYRINEIYAENFEITGSNKSSLFISAGDTFEGTAYSALTKGSAINSILKLLNLKYSAIGNHDFDWGSDFLDPSKQKNKFKTFDEDGNFKFLSCNVIDRETNKLITWAKPYELYENNGFKLAILGLASVATAEVTLPIVSQQYSFIDPVMQINKYAKEIKDKKIADAVLVVIHDGEGRNRNLITDYAGKICNVDAFISGHTHEIYSKTVSDKDGKQIPIIQAGCNGVAVGRVKIEFDEKTKKVIKVSAKVDMIDSKIPLSFLEKNPIFESKNLFTSLKEWDKKMSPILNQYLGTTINGSSYIIDFSHGDFNVLTSAGQCITALLLEAVNKNFDKLNLALPKEYQNKIDCALWNYGTIRNSIHEGKITFNSLFSVLPFEFHVCVAKIKAKDLLQVFNGIYDNGTGYGYLQFYGIKIKEDLINHKSSPFREFVSLKTNKVIPMDTELLIVTNNGLTSGAGKADHIIEKGVLKDKIEFENRIARDVIADQIKLGFNNNSNVPSKPGVIDVKIQDLLIK